MLKRINACLVWYRFYVVFFRRVAASVQWFCIARIMYTLSLWRWKHLIWWDTGNKGLRIETGWRFSVWMLVVFNCLYHLFIQCSCLIITLELLLLLLLLLLRLLQHEMHLVSSNPNQSISYTWEPFIVKRFPKSFSAICIGFCSFNNIKLSYECSKLGKNDNKPRKMQMVPSMWQYRPTPQIYQTYRGILSLSLFDMCFYTTHPIQRCCNSVRTLQKQKQTARKFENGY